MHHFSTPPRVFVPPPARKEAGRRSRQLILAVEDQPDDWRIYGKMLWYNGFDVLHATTGEQGVRLALAARPDLILADLMLPNMDGIEMCRALKRDARTAHIPVVVLTAHSDDEYGAPAREAGCDLFLEKLVGPVQVLHVVEEMIGRAPPQA